MAETRLRDMKLKLGTGKFRKSRRAKSVCTCCGLSTCVDANGPGFGNTYRCPLRFATVLVQSSQKPSCEE